MRCLVVVLLLMVFTASSAKQEAKNGRPSWPSELRKENDSLYWLNDWRLPYPVYRYETGDVDGDGQPEALVGVVKTTRFFNELGHRLFIFKMVNGKARPMWMGSKLGGILVDFRIITTPPSTGAQPFSPASVRSLELTADGQYVVAEYKWDDFGMVFQHFLVKNVDRETALAVFNQ